MNDQSHATRPKDPDTTADFYAALPHITRVQLTLRLVQFFVQKVGATWLVCTFWFCLILAPWKSPTLPEAAALIRDAMVWGSLLAGAIIGIYLALIPDSVLETRIKHSIARSLRLDRE